MRNVKPMKTYNTIPSLFDIFGFEDLSSNEVEVSVAGYAKDEVSAEVQGNQLVITADNKDRGKKIAKVFLGRGLTSSDLSIKYIHGLLQVKVKEKPKQQKLISID